MIDKETYELEWILRLSETLGKRGDPKILEKVIYAFTLLEQLRVAGLDFIFKGGTALLLLSTAPRRFSIDVDIITPVHRDELPNYLDKVVSSTMFSRWADDNKRKHTADPPVGHYKFYYTSKVDKASGEEPILLDVLFSGNPYPKLFSTLIRHAWLQTSGETHTVVVPVIESILGDKLTAFAPTTTGILYEKNRPAEIIKQLYDIAFLFDMATDFGLVRASYIRNAEEEMKYRGLNLHWKDTLRDTFQTCLTITGRDEKDLRFQHLKKGITNIVNFILERFYVEEAIVCAAKTAYLSRLIQIDNIPANRYGSPDQIALLTIEYPEYLKLNRLKKSNPEAYFYWYHALSIPL
jgi:predicted nucleotidyltransferase component of viral defense system